MDEVAAAVDAIRATGHHQLALLHCVSSYPAAPEDANLAAMATMREAFGLPTGWSDHTPGIELPVAATALGATIIEKHLTLGRGRHGPDHAMSMEPTEFAAMVTAIRATSAAIGNGNKVPTAAEREIAAVARRSLHWTRDLPAGTIIEASHLAAQRPGTGLSPARAGVVHRAADEPPRDGRCHGRGGRRVTKIAILTTGRQDWGILHSTASAIRAHPDLTLRLLVGGTHLSARHGHTVDEVRADGFEPDAELSWLTAPDGEPTADADTDPLASDQAAAALEAVGAALRADLPGALAAGRRPSRDGRGRARRDPGTGAHHPSARR